MPVRQTPEAHVRPHAPQLVGDVAMFCSHASVSTLLQLAVVALAHAVTMHADASAIWFPLHV